MEGIVVEGIEKENLKEKRRVVNAKP